MVQKQIVEKDKKTANESILDGISLASVLPGPIAFNVVTYIGYKLRGFQGAFVSMAGILLPSFLLMLLLSHLYLRFGDILKFEQFFAGILPAVAAIIFSVAITMWKKNISDVPQVSIAVLSAATILVTKTYLSTLIIMLVSGLAGFIIYHKKTLMVSAKQDIIAADGGKKQLIGLFIAAGFAAAMVSIVFLPSFLPDRFQKAAVLQKEIMLVFSGMSLSLFGGGYIVIPAMQQIVVNSMNWLSNKEFADAVAMGQVTPGPIFISATFIGYKLAGFWGGLNATISLFLPPGLLMLACASFFDKIRNSSVLISIFKGLRPAIIGMIGVAAFNIMGYNDLSLKSGLLFCIFLIVIIRFKTDPVFIIPSAGIIGFLIF